MMVFNECLKMVPIPAYLVWVFI